MTRKDMIIIGLGAFLLVLLTAGASAYVLSHQDASQQTSSSRESVKWNSARVEPAAGNPKPACDDDNIVGKVVGGVGGGLLGNQIGKGKGNTAATIGGSVGGTLLGEEYIPTRNVTCR